MPRAREKASRIRFVSAFRFWRDSIEQQRIVLGQLIHDSFSYQSCTETKNNV